MPRVACQARANGRRPGQLPYNKVDVPTALFPYNIVVTPNGKLALTADNGGGGSSDGSMDMVSVIDLEGAHPHTAYRISTW